MPFQPCQSATVIHQEEFSEYEMGHINMGEVGITHNDRISDVMLGTYGLGPCVGVAVHNPQQNSALLAHIVPDNDVASLIPHLNRIASQGAALNVSLVGGDISKEASQMLCRNVVTLFEQRQDCHIALSSLCPRDGAGRAQKLSINSNGGAIHTSFEDEWFLEPDEGVEGAMDQEASEYRARGAMIPLRLSLDGFVALERLAPASGEEMSSDEELAGNWTGRFGGGRGGGYGGGRGGGYGGGFGQQW